MGSLWIQSFKMILTGVIGGCVVALYGDKDLVLLSIVSVVAAFGVFAIDYVENKTKGIQ